MPNCYCTLDDVKNLVGKSLVADDSELLAMIEASSRAIDLYCGRHFYTETATRYFDTGASPAVLPIDDVLSITSLKTDSEIDGTYDGETWTADADYWLSPSNRWPKNEVRITGFGSYAFGANLKRYAAIAGVWGYGDGKTATAWLPTAITATVATVGGLTLTLSAAGMEAGQTILAGSEQMFLRAVATNGLSATVERAMNGTTAAIHAGAAVSTALYPSSVARCARQLSIADWNTRNYQGMESESKEAYSYTILKNPEYIIARSLGAFRRLRG